MFLLVELLIDPVIQERALAGFDFDIGKGFGFDNTPVGVACFECDGVAAGGQFEAANLNIVGQGDPTARVGDFG